jgi:hypothetical protein
MAASFILSSFLLYFTQRHDQQALTKIIKSAPLEINQHKTTHRICLAFLLAVFDGVRASVARHLKAVRIVDHVSKTAQMKRE